MEPVRFRADEILYAQSTLTPNCAASCAKAPLPASYAPRSFCRRSLLYAFAISTTSTNAKRLQRISLYTFWKFALIRISGVDLLHPPRNLLLGLVLNVPCRQSLGRGWRFVAKHGWIGLVQRWRRRFRIGLRIAWKVRRNDDLRLDTVLGKERRWRLQRILARQNRLHAALPEAGGHHGEQAGLRQQKRRPDPGLRQHVQRNVASARECRESQQCERNEAEVCPAKIAPEPAQGRTQNAADAPVL